MLGMLGHTFVSLVDNIMVGQLGTAELAAVSLGNSFIFIAMSLGIGFSMAITPLIAEADSGNDFKKGKSSFKHGLFLCTILSFALFGLILLAKPLMYLMKQPEELVTLAIPYLDLVAFSLVPLIIFQGFKQFSDGLSMTKYPMYATILANVINIILNYLLIFGKFGFPQMGIVGAAVGTLASRFIMLFFLWWMLTQKEKSKAYVTNIKLFVLESKMIKKLLNLGFPSAMQMFFEVAIFTAAIWLSGTLGKNNQAANQILLGLGLAFVFALFFLAFHNLLPNMYLNLDDVNNFTDNSEVVKIASKLLLVAAIFQLSDSIQVTVLGALRGLQDVKIPTLITFIAYWLIGFPISYFLGKEEAYASFGIWIGLLVGLTSAAIMLYIRFNYLTKKLISKSCKL